MGRASTSLSTHALWFRPLSALARQKLIALCWRFFLAALRSHGKSATFRQHYYPEGNWGWVIMVCSFLANVFTTGLQLSFGVLQVILYWGNCAFILSKAFKHSTVWGQQLVPKVLENVFRESSRRLTKKTMHLTADFTNKWGEPKWYKLT